MRGQGIDGSEILMVLPFMSASVCPLVRCMPPRLERCVCTAGEWGGKLGMKQGITWWDRGGMVYLALGSEYLLLEHVVYPRVFY